MLNLDLLERLNKQSQWQYSKITRSPKVRHRFQSYFSQQILVFSTERVEQAQKHKFPFRDYIPTKENTQISRGFTTRNYSISTTKRIAQGLIQRYKVRYSQKGVTQIHSRRKRLVVRRYGWIQNIANPLLAPTPLPDMFCNKNNAISPEAIEGEIATVPTRKSF